MGAVEEARLKGLKMKQIKGTLKEFAETDEQMEAIEKELEIYDKYLKSQKPRVLQRPGTSAKAQEISAKSKAALRQGSIESSFNTSILSSVSFKKRQTEQETSEFSSDEEKQSINKGPSTVVEDKCDAKQETGEKKLSPGILSQLGSKIDDDDVDSNASDDDELDFCFYAPPKSVNK
jgi:hypothetical protein